MKRVLVTVPFSDTQKEELKSINSDLVIQFTDSDKVSDNELKLRDMPKAYPFILFGTYHRDARVACVPVVTSQQKLICLMLMLKYHLIS